MTEQNGAAPLPTPMTVGATGLDILASALWTTKSLYVGHDVAFFLHEFIR